MSLFVEPDGRAAHLVTDAAYYDRAGRIVDFRCKVTVSEPLRMAVAVSGCADANAIARAMSGVVSTTDAVGHLPAIAALLLSDNDTAYPGGRGSGHNDLQVFAVAWYGTRARGWVLSTNRAWLGDDYVPGTLCEVDGLSSPPVPDGIFGQEDITRAAGLALDAQRLDRSTLDGFGSVGGWGELTTVTSVGITRKRVRHWPDQMGFAIA